MDIQQINRTDPESIKIVVKNVDGSGSFTVGLGVALVASAASFSTTDALPAVKGTAALIAGFLGVAAQNIPINGYGKVVNRGYAASVQISHVGSSITITAGDVLIPGAVAGTFFSTVTAQAMSTLLYKYVIACSTPVAVSTQAQAFAAGYVVS